MRRLFSTFADGAPGAGLLLMRLAAGIDLVLHAVIALLGAPPMGPALLHASAAGLGILLLAGLWTPIAGALAALHALWQVFSSGHPWHWIMMATLCAALALIGPGAWSLDARLFGWKRVEIPDRKRQTPPPL
jgi:putative oxidoreductase